MKLNPGFMHLNYARREALRSQQSLDIRMDGELEGRVCKRAVQERIAK